MANNIIHDYDKSSCRCYNCTQAIYSNTRQGIPTNFSLLNCETPAMFGCYKNKLFRSDIEPRNKNGYILINPSVIEDNNSPSVVDARLISPLHGGQILTLDSKPKNSGLKLNEIYDSNLTNYGQRYGTYSDIDAGQILYYINKSQQDPFYSSVFSNSAQVDGYLYKDPMGAIKPEYIRTPLNHHDRFESRDNYDGTLSWIADSQEYRENLMASQMSKFNEQKWTSRWTK